jgi:hypothetical protein
VLDLVRRGEIDLHELPEARDVIRHLDELDAATDDEAPVARAPIRRRFDDRSRPARPARSDADDGTVSSKTWSPPNRPAAKVWRPPADDATDPGRPPVRRAPVPKPGDRKGGISFEDDDSDLADYMHPDDVPPKPKGDES